MKSILTLAVVSTIVSVNAYANCPKFEGSYGSCRLIDAQGAETQINSPHVFEVTRDESGNTQEIVWRQPVEDGGHQMGFIPDGEARTTPDGIMTTKCTERGFAFRIEDENGNGNSYEFAFADGEMRYTTDFFPGVSAVCKLETEGGDNERKINLKTMHLPQLTVMASSNSLTDAIESGSTGHGIGFTAGMTSGIGIAYRRFITPKHGVHVGGIGWADQNTRHWNLGVEYLRTIHQMSKSRLYWGVGSAFFHEQNQMVTYPGCEEPTRPVNPTQCDFNNPIHTWRGETRYSFGPLLGFEWNPGPMGISMELPFPLSYKKDSEGFRFDSFRPIPNVSIIYYLPKKK